ncbi:MAG: signal peptidase II [Steroidobacteraceae bacterium]
MRAFTLRYNRGAAWSMLDGASGWQRWLFSGLAIVVGVALLVWLRGLNGRTQKLLSLSLTLILAGALGNLVDRLLSGQVVDFILVHWNDAQFPAFNVADSAITVGAALMLLDAFTGNRRSSN